MYSKISETTLKLRAKCARFCSDASSSPRYVDDRIERMSCISGSDIGSTYALMQDQPAWQIDCWNMLHIVWMTDQHGSSALTSSPARILTLQVNPTFTVDEWTFYSSTPSNGSTSALSHQTILELKWALQRLCPTLINLQTTMQRRLSSFRLSFRCSLS